MVKHPKISKMQIHILQIIDISRYVKNKLARGLHVSNRIEVIKLFKRLDALILYCLASAWAEQHIACVYPIPTSSSHYITMILSRTLVRR